MAVNWARVAWTLALAVLGLMAFFIYTDYAARFKERYGDIKVQPDVSSGVKRVAKPVKREGPPPKIPRRSRKYRRRR